MYTKFQINDSIRLGTKKISKMKTRQMTPVSQQNRNSFSLRPLIRTTRDQRKSDS